MVSQEYLIGNEFVNQMFYDDTMKLLSIALNIYNYGKRYNSEKIFPNTEYGLNMGLQGIQPADIVYTLSNEDGEFNINDPAFTTQDYPFRSMSEEELRRIITPEWVMSKIGSDVYDYLDDSDFSEAFETYVRKNHPELIDNWTGDWEEEHLYNIDWANTNFEELAQTLVGQQPMNEGMVFDLTEEQLAHIVRESTNRILEDSGIHIKKSHEGKLTALKKRTGKSESEIYNDGNPDHKKMVVFARNARKWKHE